MPTILLNWSLLSTSSRTRRVLLQHKASLIFRIPSSSSFISSTVFFRMSERSCLCRQTISFDLKFDRKLFPSNL
uniref:Uncharacterized protein n=1 Tax=Populus trichocarpa TaxID=3694 RepID=A0A2K1YE64_POPTR